MSVGDAEKAKAEESTRLATGSDAPFCHSSFGKSKLNRLRYSLPCHEKQLLLAAMGGDTPPPTLLIHLAKLTGCFLVLKFACSLSTPN
jgi:hypothetical protein